MLQDTRITLFLLAELVAALRANDPDLFKRWLYGGIEDLGEPAVTELVLDWLDPFNTRVERDRTDRGLAPGRQPPARLGNTDPSRNLSDVASPARGVDTVIARDRSPHAAAASS